MARPVSLVLSLLLWPALVLAQQNMPVNRARSKGYRGERWTLSNHVVLKLTPTSWADPYGALFPLGMEYYFGERFGVGLDVGIPMYYVLNNLMGKQHKTIRSDIKLHTEARQYFRLRERSRLYFGAELFYRRQEMDQTQGELHYTSGLNYAYDHIRATKYAYGTGIFVGYVRKLSAHFLAEGHTGLGLRMINMETDLNVKNLTPHTEASFNSLALPNEDRVGDRDFHLHLPFAIKIAYLL